MSSVIQQLTPSEGGLAEGEPAGGEQPEADKTKPQEGAKPQAKPRERILQAALELFVEQGYFNTNVPDISKRSRCSIGSIYHHFLNKEEIAGQLYQDGIQEFRQAIASVIDPDEDVEATIRAIVINFLDFAESNHMLSRYLWLARHNEFLSANVRKPTVVGFDSLGRKLTKVIKNGIRRGEIPATKAEVFWSIVFGIPLSYMRDWLDGYTSQNPKIVAPVLAGACWSALQGVKQVPSQLPE